MYTRADNPTSEHAERLLAALEGSGCACALFGSGMAAATAVFQSLLPGDHVLVSRVLYWGVRKWLAEFAVTWGLDVEFTDTADLGAVAAAIRPGRTRLVRVETPANPGGSSSVIREQLDQPGDLLMPPPERAYARERHGQGPVAEPVSAGSGRAQEPGKQLLA